MIVGIPKEIKSNEHRVALTPAGVKDLLRCGHKVIVETNAGLGSGFSDQEYQDQGAEIINTASEVYFQADMIVKVKEPIEVEYSFIRENQIVFTYFHFAASEKLTDAMLKSKAVCIAYETVEKLDKSLPLLTPMSEIAGRMSVQEGAKYLEKQYGGSGILLAGVPGVKPANVLILGGGVVGYNAALIAAGMGANVTLMDVNLARLRQLEGILPANVSTLFSNTQNVIDAVKQANLIIGAVLVPGAKAPVLISKDMLQYMQAGTVLVDVAVDQGGCIETCKPTTHENPTYIINSIVHYCVANMPGAVPYTSTLALTNATFPYVLQLANKGWQNACFTNVELANGLTIVNGKITSKPVADCFNREFESLKLS